MSCTSIWSFLIPNSTPPTMYMSYAVAHIDCAVKIVYELDPSPISLLQMVKHQSHLVGCHKLRRIRGAVQGYDHWITTIIMVVVLHLHLAMVVSIISIVAIIAVVVVTTVIVI